ncbi:uncharacterized protein LOC125030728 [Penaeus chinensis]|uniref:uncharacterized protein LOC125030728 n=1 Tax=Penaeus chinensis TaxID=139456 RepID=UPI001FB7DB76|nr:uncharacterized protein LOC125030728 [Penaeus chinensis]
MLPNLLRKWKYITNMRFSPLIHKQVLLHHFITSLVDACFKSGKEIFLECSRHHESMANIGFLETFCKLQKPIILLSREECVEPRTRNPFYETARVSPFPGDFYSRIFFGKDHVKPDYWNDICHLQLPYSQPLSKSLIESFVPAVVLPVAMLRKIRLLIDIILYDIHFQPGALGWLAGHAPDIKRTLNHRSWVFLWAVPKTVDSILRGISQIFKQPDAAITSGVTNFNAVLVGTVFTSVYPSICYQPMSGPVYGYMIAGAAFSVCLLSALAAILAPTKLPPFTLPFNIATCIVFICLRGRGLVGAPPDEAAGTPDGDGIEWDQVFVGWVRSVGQVYALESLVCSGLTLAGLLLYSPVLVFFAMAGALVSTVTALAVTSAPYADYLRWRLGIQRVPVSRKPCHLHGSFSENLPPCHRQRLLHYLPSRGSRSFIRAEPTASVYLPVLHKFPAVLGHGWDRGHGQ